MKKTFVIQVEYPDCDYVPSEELIEVTKESFDYLLSRYFGANIMDGDYDRIKVKEVTDGFSLVKKMREAQKELDTCSIGDYDFRQHCATQLEFEVDEWLEKLN